jgi:hypothetical protein
MMIVDLGNLLDLLLRQVWQRRNIQVLLDSLDLGGRTEIHQSKDEEQTGESDARNANNTNLIDPFEQHLGLGHWCTSLLSEPFPYGTQDGVERTIGMTRYGCQASIGCDSDFFLCCILQ